MLNAFAARFSCALCSSRSTPIWAVSSARGCVAVWDWRLLGQCCVFRQLHTDLATIRVLESRATAPLPPKAVEDGGSRARGARCLRCVDAHFCLRDSNPRPGFSPFRESSPRYAIDCTLAIFALCVEETLESLSRGVCVALVRCFRCSAAYFCLLLFWFRSRSRRSRRNRAKTGLCQCWLRGNSLGQF